MDEQQGRGDFVDVVTRMAIQLHSRRRFFKRVGIVGVALSTVGGLMRWGLGPQTAEAAAGPGPDAIVCPKGCEGICCDGTIPTSCISAGEVCGPFYCPNCCWDRNWMALGTWLAIYQNHQWYCEWECSLVEC
jgi:hypothetical protein